MNNKVFNLEDTNDLGTVVQKHHPEAKYDHYIITTKEASSGLEAYHYFLRLVAPLYIKYKKRVYYRVPPTLHESEDLESLRYSLKYKVKARITFELE